MSTKTMSSVVSDVEITQNNVPPEWRLSLGTSTIVSPAPIKLNRTESVSTSKGMISGQARLELLGRGASESKISSRATITCIHCGSSTTAISHDGAHILHNRLEITLS